MPRFGRRRLATDGSAAASSPADPFASFPSSSSVSRGEQGPAVGQVLRQSEVFEVSEATFRSLRIPAADGAEARALATYVSFPRFAHVSVSSLCVRGLFLSAQSIRFLFLLLILVVPRGSSLFRPCLACGRPLETSSVASGTRCVLFAVSSCGGLA